jgi:predicted hydrocarbon binding protein
MPARDRLADDGAGRLSMGGSRYLLIRPETLAALQHAVEQALGSAAADCLAAGGRAGGSRAAGALTGSPRERVEQMLRTGTEIGWGAFSLERLTPTEMVVTVTRSPIAEAYGPSSQPVCHLTRGVLESLAASVLEHPRQVVETDCAAAGAAACRFSTAPGDRP